MADIRFQQPYPPVLIKREHSKTKKLSYETNKRRRAAAQKRKQEQEREEKRRLEILARRRKTQQEATERFQRGNRNFTAPNHHVDAPKFSGPSLDEAMKLVSGSRPASNTRLHSEALKGTSRPSSGFRHQPTRAVPISPTINGKGPHYPVPDSTLFYNKHGASASGRVPSATTGHVPNSRVTLDPSLHASSIRSLNNSRSLFEQRLIQHNDDQLSHLNSNLQQFSEIVQKEIDATSDFQPENSASCDSLDPSDSDEPDVESSPIDRPLDRPKVPGYDTAPSQQAASHTEVIAIENKSQQQGFFMKAWATPSPREPSTPIQDTPPSITTNNRLNSANRVTFPVNHSRVNSTCAEKPPVHNTVSQRITSTSTMKKARKLTSPLRITSALAAREETSPCSSSSKAKESFKINDGITQATSDGQSKIVMNEKNLGLAMQQNPSQYPVLSQHVGAGDVKDTAQHVTGQQPVSAFCSIVITDPGDVSKLPQNTSHSQSCATNHPAQTNKPQANSSDSSPHNKPQTNPSNPSSHQQVADLAVDEQRKDHSKGVQPKATSKVMSIKTPSATTITVPSTVMHRTYAGNFARSRPNVNTVEHLIAAKPPAPQPRVNFTVQTQQPRAPTQPHRITRQVSSTEPRVKVKGILKRCSSAGSATLGASVRDSLEVARQQLEGTECKSKKKGIRWADLDYDQGEEEIDEEVASQTESEQIPLTRARPNINAGRPVSAQLASRNRGTARRQTAGSRTTALIRPMRQVPGISSIPQRQASFTATQPKEAVQMRADDLEKIHLERTPTDDDISKLWAGVRQVLDQNNADDIPSGSKADTTQKPHITVNGRHMLRVENNPTNQQTGAIVSAGYTSRLRYRSSQRPAARPTIYGPATSNTEPRHHTSQTESGSVSDSLAVFQLAERLAQRSDLNESQIQQVVQEAYATQYNNYKKNPSALSIEEQRLMASLDRLNERLKASGLSC